MTLESLQARVLDADIRYLIRAKARQLATANGFGRQDRPDLQQELTLQLLRRLRLFNPARASFYCFAMVVLDRAGMHLIEARAAECRDESSTVSLQSLVPDPDDERVPLADLVDSSEAGNRVGRYTATEAEARDLSLDVRALLVSLPAPLRRLARRMVTASRAKIARQSRIPESRIREQFQELRAAFEQAGLKTDRPRPRKNRGVR